MGLFSKKTIICEKCGKEYQARITLGIHICDECLEREGQKEMAVKGYVDYARKMYWDIYTEEQLDAIREHRDAILDKYRMTEGISIEELKTVSNNYKKLTDEEAEDVYIRVMKSTFWATTGAAYVNGFFAPVDFEKAVVDMEDVFAMGYVTDSKMKVRDADKEAILCAVFTNDPYIPVFPIVYLGDVGFFEFKSKSTRQAISGVFEKICPNLTYPIQDLKKLKKQIQAEDCVKGNIDKKFMLDQISDASVGSGIFNTKKAHTELPSSVSEMLEEYGYIESEKIDEIMKMDKIFNRRYWNKVANRVFN